MRRREPVTAEKLGKLPPELALGRCVEVWGWDGDDMKEWGNALQAFTRWSHGFSAYCDERGIERGSRRYSLNRRAGGPWSVAFMTAAGHADQVEQRFAAAGVTLDDIPKLQRAAKRRVEAWERRP